jgi:hypothetical protein
MDECTRCLLQRLGRFSGSLVRRNRPLDFANVTLLNFIPFSSQNPSHPQQARLRCGTSDTREAGYFL